MSARLISSTIWVVLLLVAPLRLLVEQLSQLLWPSVQPFTLLAGLHPRWVPFIVLVLLGYLATYGISTVILKELPRPNQLFWQPEEAPSFVLPATVATVSWVILAALLAQLSMALLLVAVLVVVGLTGRFETTSEEPPEPLPLPTPPDPLPSPEDEELTWKEDSEDTNHYYRTYSWLFNEEPYRKSGRTHRFDVGLSIPRSLYEDLLARDHTVRSSSDFVGYANAQLDDENISHLAAQLRHIAEKNDFDDLTEIHLAMAFTLCMPYAFDKHEYDGGEHPKFPIEMLVDKRGDCEDFSILCGTLLHRLGHPTALVLMSFAHLEHGHAALGVVPPEHISGEQIYSPELGAGYFYCEVTPSKATTETTTDVQWWLGMSAPEGARDFKVYPIGH